MYICNKDFGVKQEVSGGGELKTPRSFQGPKEISAGNVHLFQVQIYSGIMKKICMYVYNIHSIYTDHGADSIIME